MPAHVPDPDLRPCVARFLLPRGKGPRPREVIRNQTLPRSSSRKIEVVCIILHHPRRVIDRADRFNTRAHAGDPFGGQAFAIQSVEKRSDLPLEQTIERGGIKFLLKAGVGTGDFLADRPAILAGRRLVPPSVANAAVERAVGGDLLTAGAAGFERARRRVEPDIHAVVKITRDFDVVIFHEDDPVTKRRHLRDFVNLLDELFAFFIRRMRLTRENKLHRPRRVVDDRRKTVEIAEQQCRTFVGSKPTRKANRENAWVQNAPRRPDLLGATLRTRAVASEVLPDKFNQSLFELLVRLPKFRILPAHRLSPELRIGHAVFPVDGTGVLEKLLKLWRHPRLRVDAVGDVANRDFLRRQSRPEALPHLPRDAPMNRTHAVGLPRRA